MISASHNPHEDNGIKLFGPDGFKLSDATEAEIEALVGSDLHKKLAAPAALGRAKRIDGATERYVEYAKRTLPRDLTLEGMRVVIDCANGAGYAVSPQALAELGAEVFAVGVTPDGFNINRDVGSTSPAALIAEVKARRADIGIALDGDADRVVLTDEKGQFVDGDQLLAVIAASWAEDHRLAKPAIVVSVMSNLGLERYLKRLGVALIRAPVGDRYVVESMRENGCNLGGEQSGHIIMSDYTTTGDGLVAALQLLAVVKKLNRPVSEVCHRFEPVPQILRNVRVANGRRPLESGRVKGMIAAANDRLAERGRLVVRASGTEPLIRVMAEGDDRAMIEEVVAELVSVLGEAGAAAEESGRAS
jgi:phosphoglucosamine mutase